MAVEAGITHTHTCVEATAQHSTALTCTAPRSPCGSTQPLLPLSGRCYRYRCCYHHRSPRCMSQGSPHRAWPHWVRTGTHTPAAGPLRGLSKAPCPHLHRTPLQDPIPPSRAQWWLGRGTPSKTETFSNSNSKINSNGSNNSSNEVNYF